MCSSLLCIVAMSGKQYPSAGTPLARSTQEVLKTSLQYNVKGVVTFGFILFVFGAIP